MSKSTRVKKLSTNQQYIENVPWDRPSWQEAGVWTVQDTEALAGRLGTVPTTLSPSTSLQTYKHNRRSFKMYPNWAAMIATESRGYHSLLRVIKYYHTIIHHLSVCLSVLPSFLLSPNYHPKFDFQENRTHDSVQTRPLCWPETSDVQYPLSLYGCIQLLQLNDFWVVLVSPLIIVYSPMAADGSALCCTIGGSHGRS